MNLLPSHSGIYLWLLQAPTQKSHGLAPPPTLDMACSASPKETVGTASHRSWKVPPWTRDARMPISQVNRWLLTYIMGTHLVADLRPWVGGQLFMAPLVHRRCGQGQRQQVSRMSGSGKWVARESSCLWKRPGTQVSSKTR